MKATPFAPGGPATEFPGRFLARGLRAICLAVAVAGLVDVVIGAPRAHALSCARTPYGAGCIGPRGAVGFNGNGAVFVGRYGNVDAYRRGSACYWRNNQRICP
jgi:hypothetical protein